MKQLLQILLREKEISSLSYFFARFISQKANQEIDSLLAYSAALVSQNNQKGDVCVELQKYSGRPLFQSASIPSSQLPQGIQCDQWQKQLHSSNCVGSGGDDKPLILEENRLYLNRFWFYETGIARLINHRLGISPDIDPIKLAHQLAILFPDREPESNPDEQRQAVAHASTRAFTVISGGPGTGKTTTVIKILYCLLCQNPKLKIKLAAPTGKAAARLMESIRTQHENPRMDSSISALIPTQASTIHRLLNYRNHHFHHNRSNPLALDYLVIDEASMIDISLMYQLLEALPANAGIILLGDKDQLASVSAGNVLGDITGHGHVVESHNGESHTSKHSENQTRQLSALLRQPPANDSPFTSSSLISDAIVLLNRSYRFDSASAIGRLAKLINQGQGEAAIECLVNDSTQLDWLVPQRDKIDTDIFKKMVSSYQAISESNDVSDALATFEKARILCATHSGPFGVDVINDKISRQLMPSGAVDGFRGQPIMITSNDYEIELFNGDTGLLWPDDRGILRACFRDFDRQIRMLPIHSLPRFETAWAMTIHKAQGSEFDTVFLIIADDLESNLVSRELFYTGVTRARQKLQIVGSRVMLLKACRQITERSSGLAEKLGWGPAQTKA